jgi:hypothetical protein
VFRTDVVVTHLACFFDRVFKHQLGVGSQFDLVVCYACLAGDPLDYLAHPFRLQAEFAQNTPCHSAVFHQQTNQQVFSADKSLVSVSASW